MGGIRCVIPVRVTVAGTPDPEQLEALTERVSARVGAQLDRAARELQQARARGAAWSIGADPDGIRERWDPDRVAPAEYATPSYDDGGRRTRLPAAAPRRWVVLRAVDFRATVAEFLAAVARQRPDGELPEAVLYADQATQERWVEAWWIRTEVTTGLADLDDELVTRACELAHCRDDQVLATVISPFTAAWEELSAMDDSGAMDRLPRPGAHNAHRVDGGGRDATVLHGGWVIFAFMVLPAVTVGESLLLGPGELVSAAPADVTPLVDVAEFLRRTGVEWSGYAAELAAERIEVRVLPLRVRRQVLGMTAWYLAALAAAGTFGASGPADTFGVQDLFLLTDAELARLPPALTAGPRAWAGGAAPATAVAAPDRPLAPGWPLVQLSAAIPVDDERIGRVRHGPASRALAERIRAALAADTGAHDWPTRMQDLLRGALGTAPDRRPPGGTLFEHTLRELDATHDLTRLLDAADEAASRGGPLRFLLYQLAAATAYAALPRVAALGADLSARRAATRNNAYQAGGAGTGWVDLRHDPARRVRAGDVFGDVDSVFLNKRTEKQLRPQRAAALAQALLEQRDALVRSVGSGQDAAEYSDEAFAREVLARAVRAAGITNDDFTDVDIERSMQLAEVVPATADGLPSFEVRFRFVERVAGGRWQPVGHEAAEAVGDFEARLVLWELGRAGEFYEAVSIGITIVGGLAFAFEAGLAAALADLAGGTAAVAASITISEVIYVIRALLGKDELSPRGLLLAALDGYINALTFRLGGIAGRWTAASIGTASVRRVIAGWVTERLVTGAVGGAGSGALGLFAHDVVDVVTGTGCWSGVPAYARGAGLGTLLGVAAEFTVQPALHAVVAGGTSTLSSVAEAVARVRAEGMSGLQFSAAITEAMANLRAALTEIAETESAAELAKAITERLSAVAEGLGASAVTRRVLELSGARFSREATAGLQRFLTAADAAGSPQRALDAIRIFGSHPQETVHFLEALSALPQEAATHLVTGTFGSAAELAAFLARIGRYEPSAQRAIVRLLGELGIVAEPSVPGATAEQGLQRQLDLALRLEAAGQETKVAALRREAQQVREEADITEAADPSRTRRVATLRRRAKAREDEADALAGRAGALRSAVEGSAAEASAGEGGVPRSVVPRDEEVERAIDALETGTGRGGGPQAWVLIPARAVRDDATVLERVARPLFRSRSGNRVVFRVEGGTPPAASREFTRVAADGSVRLATGGNPLNLNFGVFERAIEFLLEHRPGARLKVFEVEEGWFSQLRGIATPEQGSPAIIAQDPNTGVTRPVPRPGAGPGISDVPRAPRIVDTRYGYDQVQIPASLVRELQEFIVPGTGRVLEFTP